MKAGEGFKQTWPWSDVRPWVGKQMDVQPCNSELGACKSLVKLKIVNVFFFLYHKLNSKGVVMPLSLCKWLDNYNILPTQLFPALNKKSPHHLCLCKSCRGRLDVSMAEDGWSACANVPIWLWLLLSHVRQVVVFCCSLMGVVWPMCCLPLKR